LLGLPGLLALCLPSLGRAAVHDSWNFNATANTTLNLATNGAPGRTTAAARWDVAIPGLATTGTGALRVRNNGLAGTGRRTSYLDFAFEQITGTESLRLRLAGWNLALPAAGPPPRLDLAFIQGSATVAAGLVLEHSAAGLRLGWLRAGSTTTWRTVNLAASSNSTLDLRLSVNLTERLLVLVIEGASANEVVGVAALPAAINRLTSLRLAVSGDFTANGQSTRFLDLDQLSIEDGAVADFPGLAIGTDGLSGLLRIALGLERPGAIAADAMPRLVDNGSGTLVFHFQRARSDLDYSVEVSRNLATWELAALNPGQPESLASVSLVGYPISEATPRLFARLRVAVPAAP